MRHPDIPDRRYPNRPCTFVLVCENEDCELFDKLIEVGGYIEGDTGAGIPDTEECEVCGQALGNW